MRVILALLVLAAYAMAKSAAGDRVFVVGENSEHISTLEKEYSKLWAGLRGIIAASLKFRH